MCKVDGCDMPNRSGSMDLCEKHYMRMYRNGTLGLTRSPAQSFEHSSGYILSPAKGHFLARGSTHAYEHRLVYWSNHGDGPFSCHWCGVSVTWDTMHVDHVDDDVRNNDAGNLVASCPVCNQQRGAWKKSATWSEKTGITARGRTQTLSQWSRELGISRAALKFRINAGWPLDAVMSRPRGKTGPKPLRNAA